MMIGAALFNARQTGLDKQQAVQEKLAPARLLSRGDQCPPHCRDRARRGEPGRALDAEPITALHGASAGLFAAEHDDAHLPASCAAVRSASPPTMPRSRTPESAAWLDRYYSINVDWQCRGAAAAARLRARSAQFRLGRPSAHLPAIRPVAAVCAPRRGLPEFRLGCTAPLRAQSAGLSHRVLRGIEPPRPRAARM